MSLLAILFGVGMLTYVHHKTSWKSRPAPPPEEEWKCTSYGYNGHNFRAYSAKEAQQIMDYLDKSDARKERMQALKNVKHGHDFNPYILKCRQCGMTEEEYRSKINTEEICPHMKMNGEVA